MKSNKEIMIGIDKVLQSKEPYAFKLYAIKEALEQKDKEKMEIIKSIYNEFNDTLFNRYLGATMIGTLDIFEIIKQWQEEQKKLI